MQLAGITGNRPGELLAVRHRHIKVTLLPDPEDKEQPRVLREILFDHTKGYLGEKDANVFLFHVVFAAAADCIAVADGRVRNDFGIPDVPNERCLLLCPHIIILALLFADLAFAALSLTSREHLLRLRIAPGQKQLPMPLTDKMADRSLLQQTQMTNLGSITGMEPPTGSYLSTWQRASSR